MGESSKSKLWYFENFNILKAMSEKEMHEINNKSTMKHTKASESIYLPGDTSHSIYFLKEGKVKISSYSDDGKELTHAILGPGELFGEQAITGDKVQEQRAESTENAVICSISVQEFQHFLEQNPQLNLNVTKLIGFRLKKVRSRLEALWFKKAPDRVKQVLKDLAEEHGRQVGDEIAIELKLTHQDLASLSATTRQTVTTIMNQMEKENLLTYDRKRILLHEPGKL
ncbi:MAG TPA: Crp/Fnr family transcriptional regulator [Bacteroidales bacterium]|nr:Crp/Fnr family transcriptional regulator [Bacteroidales bacterium]